MTGTNDKIRGLFLAAIMVLSVVAMTTAFSGTVAAAGNGPTVQTSVEYNGNVTIAFDLSLNESATAGTDLEVYIDDTQIAPGSYTVASDGTNGNLTITGLTDVQPVSTVKVELSQPYEAATGSDPIEGNISVTETSAETYEANAREVLDVYQGEIVAIKANTNGDSIKIRNANNGNLVLDGGAAANGSVISYDTSSLSIGTAYNISFQGTTAVNTFRVNDLQLSATATDTSLATTQNLTVDVSAIRGGEMVTGVLLDSNGDPVGTNRTATLSSSSGEATLNFGTQTAGDYSVIVTDHPSGVQDTTNTVTVSQLNPDASFAQADFADNRGDIVAITVEVSDTANATVQVGDIQNDGYSANISVNDGDANGQVTLLWNTFEAQKGGTGEFSVADSDDAVNGGNITTDVDGHAVSNNVGQSDLLHQGTYDLQVAPGNGTVFARTASSDVATATLQARSTDAVTIWTAPSRLDGSLTSVSAIRDELGANITQAGTVANNDLVVHEISASGLEGALANNTGAAGQNDTHVFMRAAGSSYPGPANPNVQYTDSAGGSGDVGTVNTDSSDMVWDLSIGQANPANNRDPKFVHINDSYDAINVVADAANDTYFVVLDTGDATVERGGNFPGFAAGDVYATNFTVYNYRVDSNNYGLTTRTNDAGTPIHETAQLGIFQFQNAEATVSTDRGGIVRVRAQDNQTIRGTTTVAAGSQLSIRVQTKQGAQNAFLLPATVLVQQTEGPTNAWVAEYDFSDRAVGTEFTVDVRRGGNSLLDTRADGVIQGEPIVQALSFSDQQSTGSSVVVDEAQLSDGGFIAIHQGSPTGDVIGNSGYLEAGESHTNIAIALDPALDSNAELFAMPHLDTNNNQAYDFPQADAPYVEGGSPVTDAASITVGPQETPTPPPETPTPPPETPTPPPETPTPTPGDTGPGFGVVVSLIALLAAGLLAVRRRS